MAPITDIADRLTPSVPIEQTFAAQTQATGTKKTTIFGHMLANPGTGTPYQVYNVINVGDPVAAQTEVDALAGVGSQIGKMTAAFISANAAAGRSNFPAFRVVLLPNAELHFGPNQEAITAVKFLRSDMFVSPYPSSDTTNYTTLLTLNTLVSGIDRDLQGQFGSFMTVASLDALATQVAYALNNRGSIAVCFPDSNTDAIAGATGTTALGSNVITAVSRASLAPTGTTTSGSAVITAVSSTAGIYLGAAITGTGIPANSTVLSTTVNSITISANATSSNAAEALSVTNLPTAGIYPGATISGTGIPAATVVQSVAASTITVSNAATSANTGEALTIQNVVSQPSEIVAAAYAGAMMSSAFPYNPLNGVTVGGLIPPQKTTDRIDVDPNGASETALRAGLSPLYVQPGGTVGFIRTRVTYHLLPDNVTAVTSYFDWQDLVTLNDFREDCYGITQNPPFNNNPGGTKASITIANQLKDEILAEAQLYEDNGAFQGVKTLAPLFIVQPSTTSRGRFDFRIPVNVLPGLQVLAGNIVAQSALGNFTL